MAKNDFLARQRQREQDVFDAGMRIGRQQMCDYITLALRDPAVMGKDTFGGKRIVAVLQGVKRLMEEFHPLPLTNATRLIITRKSWTGSCGRHTGTRSRKDSSAFTTGMSA